SLGKRRRRSPPSTVSRRLMGFGEESLESLVLGVISARAARSRRRARDPHASPWSSLFWRRRVKKRGSATPAMLSSARRFSHLVQRRLRRDEIARVESFGEPSIDGRERVARRGVAALVAEQARQARRGAELEAARELRTGDGERVLVAGRHLLGRTAAGEEQL